MTAPTPPECDPERVETVARAIASEAIGVTLVTDDEWHFYLRSDEQEDYRRLAAAAIAALPPSPAELAIKRVEALAEHMDGSAANIYRKAAKLLRAALDPSGAVDGAQT